MKWLIIITRMNYQLLYLIIIEDNLSKENIERPEAYHKMKDFLKSEN